MSVDTTAVSTQTVDTTQPNMPADGQHHDETCFTVTGRIYAQERYKWVRTPNVYNDPAPPDLFIPGPLGTHTYNQSCHLAADAPVGSTALALVEFSSHKYSVDKRNGGPDTGLGVAPQYAEQVAGSQSYDRQLLVNLPNSGDCS